MNEKQKDFWTTWLMGFGIVAGVAAALIILIENLNIPQGWAMAMGIAALISLVLGFALRK